MRNPLKFAKPRGPGFGIARDFYLSVLMGDPTPPAIAEVVNPRGEGGAVEGFGVPLAGEGKALLARPMERGQYAVATKSRTTVLRMLLMPTGEAGFDAEAVARSPLADRLTGETITRLRASWRLAQLSFESHDPAVYPALDFLLDVAIRLAALTDGVVADPIARRYETPDELSKRRALRPVDARAHVAVESSGEETYTLGLRKFALPELLIVGATRREAAERLLLSAAQGVLVGGAIGTGSRLPAEGGAFEVRDAIPQGRWRDVPALELLPPTGRTADDLLPLQ